MSNLPAIVPTPHTPANESAVYKGQIGVIAREQGNAEYLDGVLVYPYYSSQTPTYTNGQVSSVETTESGITYTMTMNYTNAQVATIVVTDDTTSDTYTMTVTYVDNQVTAVSDWVKT